MCIFSDELRDSYFCTSSSFSATITGNASERAGSYDYSPIFLEILIGSCNLLATATDTAHRKHRNNFPRFVRSIRFVRSRWLVVLSSLPLLFLLGRDHRRRKRTIEASSVHRRKVPVAPYRSFPRSVFVRHASRTSNEIEVPASLYVRSFPARVSGACDGSVGERSHSKPALVVGNRSCQVGEHCCFPACCWLLIGANLPASRAVTMPRAERRDDLRERWLLLPGGIVPWFG